MLQSMRDNLKGTAAIIVAAFFGFIMVIGGIDFFTGASGGSADQVAAVNGEKISNIDLQRAIQNRRNMIESQYGENVPADLLTDEQLRGPVLQQLVNSSVMRQVAQERGMVMSAAAVDREIVQMPGFQVNGQFDQQMYRDGLRRMGYSPTGFRQLLEQEMVMQQYIGSVSDSAFATRVEAEEVVSISMEERDFDYLTLSASPLLAEIQVSDAEVQAYYDENQQAFLHPEQVAIEYIELTPEQFAANLDVSEEDVRAQYDQEVKNFQASIRRHAAHILIEGDDEAAQKKVGEVQAKLSEGAEFEALAKEYSDDIVSREEGGDVGFTSGDVFPEPFEDALADLEVGQVSGAVKTEAGTHFIKLIEVADAEPPSFEERKAAIAARLRTAEAEREFVGAVSRLGDLAYNAETLAGPAEELGVSVQKSPLFSRQGGAGVTAEGKVVEAAFSPEVMEDGNTSDVLNLSENHSVVLRVVEHKPAGVKPLEAVKQEITQRLKRDKASEQLASKARSIKEQVQAGEALADVASAEELTLETSDNTRRGGFGARGEVVEHAFGMDAPKPGAKSLEQFTLGSGDVVVVQLRDVRAGDLSRQSKEQREALMQQLASMQGTAELAAVQNYLSSKADIELSTTDD
ncbi:SurA N-terminal domain-containing protein [Microbulbifer hydrolyticus]|uniref:Periplasmic chaperone PpiD n=1 Tax=Microbulbifer hydrolyticus TaxID=48074 RepID=A0A6P1TB37_9GAMM|nr:SurA N-terminal domain-containing protein [Microbulbifer hydrolyticus]MBB5210678.1 peptidyl-prolyl cis-trans isomerase D [Microbulbifer hydrolyticus]QHQ38863.1 peptidylprolyl isomerase [Microbulbifer hydrolyticus]